MWKILGDGATGEPNSSSFAEKTYLENVRNNLTHCGCKVSKTSTYSLMLEVSNNGGGFEFPVMRV